MKEETIQKIKEKAVKNGIKSLYTEKKNPFILDGGREGFEMSLTFNYPQDFHSAIRGAENEAMKLMEKKDVDKYWRARYKVLQLQWMFEIMKYVWGGYNTYSARAGIAISKVMQELGLDEKELGYYKQDLLT